MLTLSVKAILPLKILQMMLIWAEIQTVPKLLLNLSSVGHSPLPDETTAVILSPYTGASFCQYFHCIFSELLLVIHEESNCLPPNKNSI